MFDAQKKSIGSGYTATVALLSMAFVFIPAILIVSRPFGYFVLALAIGCSALCAILAWTLWRKSSRRTIPAIAIQKGRSELAKSGLLAIPLLCAALGTPMVRAADFSSYRGIEFGMNLSAAAEAGRNKPNRSENSSPAAGRDSGNGLPVWLAVRGSHGGRPRTRRRVVFFQWRALSSGRHLRSLQN